MAKDNQLAENDNTAQSEQVLKELSKEPVLLFGIPGDVFSCRFAISTILNSNSLPESATIVALGKTREQPYYDNYLFVFWNWGPYPVTIVPNAFASGYSGTGPRTFSLALCLLKSKNILLFEYWTNEHEFYGISQGRYKNANGALFRKIKIKGSRLHGFHYDWILLEHDDLLKRGIIWQEISWCNPKTDLISQVIGELESVSTTLAAKLSLTLQKVSEVNKPEEWQSAGILIRDSWIEFCNVLCQGRIDTSKLSPNDVKGILPKFKVKDELEKLAKSNYDLSLSIQHDRHISNSQVKACLMSTIFTMHAIIIKVLDDATKISLEIFDAKPPPPWL